MRMQKLVWWSCFFIGIVPSLLFTLVFPIWGHGSPPLLFWPWLTGILMMVISPLMLWRCYKKEPAGQGRYQMHLLDLLLLSLAAVPVTWVFDNGDRRGGIVFSVIILLLLATGLLMASRKNLHLRYLYAVGFAFRAVGAVFMSYLAFVIVERMLKIHILPDSIGEVFGIAARFLLGGEFCCWWIERAARKLRGENAPAEAGLVSVTK